LASNFDEKPKRKTSEGRRFQWWLLILGFWIGVVVAVMGMSGRGQPSHLNNPNMQDGDLWMTATAILQQATNTAAAPSAESSAAFDSKMTATAIVQQATNDAAAESAASDAEIDSLMMTATAIVAEATRQAGG
jgi:hypothetical protein